MLCTALTASVAADGKAGIDAGNVGGLHLAWSWRLDGVGAESSPPATAGGQLFVLGAFPHTLWALDPAAPAEKRVRWQYIPIPDRSAQGRTCCVRQTHGPVAASGSVFFTTVDGHLLALDPQSGAVRFDTPVIDPQAGEALANAPLVAEGKVYVGSAGDDAGVRGWLAALDAASGKLLWKRYSTGPDEEVGIGASFKPFQAALRGANLGTRSWPPSAWRQGGGSVAGSLLYDEATHAVYHETGHPAPWNPEQRAGDDLWTAGVFARDAGTGAARWFTGFNPHDPYEYGNAGSDVLMTLEWSGRPRDVLVHPDANGLLYVLDRATGQILAADAVTPSVVSSVDMASGKTRYDPSKAIKVNTQTRDVCPAWTGAFGAGSGVLADAGLLALPVSRMCMDIEPRSANYIKGTPYMGANVRLRLGPAPGGAVVGWNVARRQSAWQVDEPLPVLGGTLVTESGLVFYGTLEGAFKALDGRTGKLLWQFKGKEGIMSRPVAFQGTDGRTYVAVVAGTGRLFGMSRTEALDPRDETAGAGWGAALRQLPEDAEPASTLLVFGLP